MKRTHIIAVAAAAAVVGGGALAGAALGSDGDEGTHGRALTPVGAPADAAPAASGDADDGGPGGDVDASGSAGERAVGAALAEVPGVVTEIERGDDGRSTWEVDVFGNDGRWHVLRVSEDGGEVLADRTRADGDDDGDDDRADVSALRAEGVTVDAATAVAIAEEDTGARLHEASVDDGRWEVELTGDDGREHELAIDLVTGEILQREQEDDGDDDNGGRQTGSPVDDRDDSRDDDGDDRDDDDRDDDRGDDDRDDDGDDNRGDD